MPEKVYVIVSMETKNVLIVPFVAVCLLNPRFMQVTIFLNNLPQQKDAGIIPRLFYSVNLLNFI